MRSVHTALCERRINGAVLVGGASRRMGRPKQLLVHRGATLSERAVEAQAACGRLGPRHLTANGGVICPAPPAELIGAWENVNTPEEMASVSVTGETEQTTV